MKFKIKKQLLNEQIANEDEQKVLKQKAIDAFAKALKGIAWMDGSSISFEKKPSKKDYIISDDDFDQQTIDFNSLKTAVEEWRKAYLETPKYNQDYEASQKAARAQADAEEKAAKEQASQTIQEVETGALETAAREEATKLLGTINDYYYTGKNISKQELDLAISELETMSQNFTKRQKKVARGAKGRDIARKQKEEEILNKMSSVSGDIKSLNAAASGTEGLEFDLNDFKKVMKAMVANLDEQERQFFKEKIFAGPIQTYLDDKAAKEKAQNDKESAKTKAETDKQAEAEKEKQSKEKAEQDKQTAEKQKGEKPIVDAMKILNNFTLKDGDAYRLDDDFIRDHKDEIKNAIKLLTTHLMVLQETLKRYNNLLKEAPVSPQRYGNYEEQEQTNPKQQNAQPVAKKLEFDINDKEQILKLLKAIKERLKKIEGEDSSKDQAQKAGEQEKAAKGKILNDIITILDFFKDDVEIGKGFEVAADKKSWFGLGKNKRQAQADQIAKEWKGAKSFVKYLADNLPKIDKEQKVALIKKYGDTIANIGEIFGESNITNFVSLQESKKYKLNLIKNKRG